MPKGSGDHYFDWNDSFYLTECTNVCSYADDTTFHVCNSDLKDLITRLEHDPLLVTEWFQVNYMKLNEEKCYILKSGHKHELLWANIGWSKILESEKQKLLGFVRDWNLHFDEYILSQCKKSLQKFFIESQFGYCPLVWMCYNRSCNNYTNHLHERALWIAYNDNASSFEELFRRDQSVGIRHTNIRLLERIVETKKQYF